MPETIVNTPIFPTALHKQTAMLTAGFFADVQAVDTLLVVNSCARGKAVAESDLDFAVLLRPGTTAKETVMLEQKWLLFSATHPDIILFSKSHRFANIHLDVFDGQFKAHIWDDGGGPDDFELEIGNRVAYPAVMGTAGDYFLHLQKTWLPFYEANLRRHRFDMVNNALLYDLDRIPYLQQRGLYFAAFDALYKAFRQFLQALFIGRHTYPLSYNKWIQEQVETMLQLPRLYHQLPGILSVTNIAGDDILRNADQLKALADEYLLFQIEETGSQTDV